MKNGKRSGGLWMLLFLVAAAYVFAMFQGGFVSWFMLYTILPIAVFAGVLYLFAFSGLTVKRTIEKQRYSAGEHVKVILEFENPLRIPLIFLIVKDHWSYVLYAADQETIITAYPWFKKQFRLEYTIEHIPRGVYRWDDITIEVGDMFGIIKREKTFDISDDIIVYPKYDEIRSWRSYNEKNTGSNYSFQRQDEDVSTVMGIRDYAPGDRLARIHWKATARTNSLKTKEYEHQVTNDFMFFINREKQAYLYETSPLFERCVNVTASLYRYALFHRFSAGLVSYGADPTVIRLSKDTGQLYRGFEHLARIKADSTYSFAKTVLREVAYLPVGTTVVLISPVINKAITSVIGDLSYRKVKVELFLVLDRPLTTEEQTCLGMLERSQATYYLVDDKPLNKLLAGGGQHVSA